MGVDLKEIVKPVKTTLEELSNWTVAIDAYNALYQFLSIIRGEAGEHLADSYGRVTSHLSGLFYRNVNLLMLGIKPIYVLDGVPPSLKAIEIDRRKVAKQEATVRYLQALADGRKEDAKKYVQFTSVIKEYMIDDTKRILDLLGIPWAEAPSEGEATAAHLSRIGRVKAAASQDYDSLLFGATTLVRNVTISGRRKLPGKRVFVEVRPEIVELDKVLVDLGMTREQLVDVAILVGTDFNPDGFPGIGPIKALKLIKSHGALEEILGDLKEQIKEIDYYAIREIFLKPQVIEDFRPSWNEIDHDGVVNFLCGERDFSKERVGNTLQKLREVKEKRSETLERWFS